MWGEGTLRNGLIAAALILPVFAFRHYVQDGGRFPTQVTEAAYDSTSAPVLPRAGMLPWLALAGFVATMAIANFLSVHAR